MPTPSVYSPAMQVNAPPALLQRIGRLLRAKESLVFYAIGLALLDLAAPLATGWLFRHRSLATLLGTGTTVAGDAVAGHTVAVVAVALSYLLVSAFFTAGYLRSLLGRLHWGPRDGRQFARLLALLVLIAAISWGLAALQGLADSNTTLALLVVVAQMIVNVPLLYAEYAVVVSNVGPGLAIWRSLQAFAANPLVSLLVLYCLLLVSFLLWQLLPGDKGAALSLAPTMLIHVLVWGCISFLADVVLLSVYIDTIERGTLPAN
ncbi:MAG TPA: hypothetical protein VL117_04840 [Thermoleophilia bacterium]|nr:hypothetical protein [Thermoleophilia bacterium]